MSKPTGISLDHFESAVKASAKVAGYGKVEMKPNKGSQYTFRFFEKESDEIPCAIFAIHVLHNKKKEIVTSDFEKAWERTAINESVLKSVLENVFGYSFNT